MRNSLGLSLLLGAVVGLILAGVLAFGAVALSQKGGDNVPKNSAEYDQRSGKNVPVPPNYGSS